MSTGCQKTIFQYVNMSVCQYVNMSVCSMSICQYVRMQLFSLVIKMKVVPNVIRRKLSESVSESEWVRVRESLSSINSDFLACREWVNDRLKINSTSVIIVYIKQKAFMTSRSTQNHCIKKNLERRRENLNHNEISKIWWCSTICVLVLVCHSSQC